MRKRTAASPANYDFAQAYSELVKLRKEIARIEKSSRPHLADRRIAIRSRPMIAPGIACSHRSSRCAGRNVASYFVRE
jgi:hypothetical protein